MLLIGLITHYQGWVRLPQKALETHNVLRLRKHLAPKRPDFTSKSVKIQAAFIFA